MSIYTDNEVSLKAKGLLSEMLSFPDNWNYSIAGLVAVNKENETSIKSTLEELKQFGYLKITKMLPNETKSGRIEYVYDIFEEKQEGKKQGVENLGVEFLEVENQGQYNINNKINNDKINNKYIYMGIYKRIKLTQEQYDKLINEFGESYINQIIEKLDEYVESNNNKNKYSNYNLVIRKAIREKWFNLNKEPTWLNQENKIEIATEAEQKEMENLLKEWK
jgi:Arc/MetJ-type ribon-helix-helix transcriptional regulator